MKGVKYDITRTENWKKNPGQKTREMKMIQFHGFFFVMFSDSNHILEKMYLHTMVTKKATSELYD